MTWISVKNRTPPEGEYVLCYLSNPLDNGEYGSKIKSLYLENKLRIILDIEVTGLVWSMKGFFYRFNDVTHWQPLPEPPNEDLSCVHEWKGVPTTDEAWCIKCGAEPHE